MGPVHFQVLGKGSPLVILHGLFGSGDNWLGPARRWQDTFRVHLPDCRNHGRSFHGAPHDYPALCADLLAWLDTHSLDRVHLLGHSMGGKTAMAFAAQHPRRVASLVVADIAPRKYPPRHRELLETLNALDPGTCPSRADADARLARAIPEPGLRGFFLKSLEPLPDGGYRWRLNLPVLTRHYGDICAAPDLPAAWDGPALFLAGEHSDYIQPGDEPVVRRHFPQAQVIRIGRAGHWLHAENPEAVSAACMHFWDRTGAF